MRPCLKAGITSRSSPDFRGQTWAVPKDVDGKVDHNAALTGADLIKFVNDKFFRSNLDMTMQMHYLIGC